MRLITHNLLMCHSKACTGGEACFPLRIEDAELAEVEAEFNPEFLRRFMPRIHWGALLGIDQLPSEAPNNMDDDLLKRVHHVLMEASCK
ncbi:hypothetical protein HK405_005617 [Cladochytrium tenue]|nr:hypothetical protein HK405_005617 [Cladochytrium tenue]